MVAQRVWSSYAGKFPFLRHDSRNIAVSDEEPELERIRHAARVANIADYIEASSVRL